MGRRSVPGPGPGTAVRNDTSDGGIAGVRYSGSSSGRAAGRGVHSSTSQLNLSRF